MKKTQMQALERIMKRSLKRPEIAGKVITTERNTYIYCDAIAAVETPEYLGYEKTEVPFIASFFSNARWIEIEARYEMFLLPTLKELNDYIRAEKEAGNLFVTGDKDIVVYCPEYDMPAFNAAYLKDVLTVVGSNAIMYWDKTNDKAMVYIKGDENYAVLCPINKSKLNMVGGAK